MKHTGKILINGQKQTLAYGTSVRNFPKSTIPSKEKVVFFFVGKKYLF